jgi:hypothetical protein
MRSLQLYLPRSFGVDANHAEQLDSAASLRRLLSRARVNRLTGQEFDANLLQSFAVERQCDWPVAPFTWLADGGDPNALYWLRADPVHLRAERDVLVLVDAPHIGLDRAAADKFVATLNGHFASDGLVFHAPTAERWYVGLRDVPGIATHPLSAAAGRSVSSLLPFGSDALLWHGRFNEVQMLFHPHPVNQEREAQGQLTVNSIWFWGGGTIPSPVRGDFAAVWSDDPLAHGLASASRSPWSPTPPGADAWLNQATDGSHLVTLGAPDKTDVSHWDRTWFAPLLQALKEKRLAEVSLIMVSGDDLLRYDVAVGDLWKFWRRAPAQMH